MKKTIFLLLAVFCLCAALAEEGRTYFFRSEEIEVYTDEWETATVSVRSATSLPVNYLRAYEITIDGTLRGRVQVDFPADGSNENLRAVRIDGNTLTGINAEYNKEKVSFFIDGSGTYALLSVDSAAQNDLSLPMILCAAAGLTALAIGCITYIRRRK